MNLENLLKTKFSAPAGGLSTARECAAENQAVKVDTSPGESRTNTALPSPPVPSSCPSINATLQKYEDEWTCLFLDNDDPEIGELHRTAVTGCLRGSHFRSVAWRRLLGVLPVSQKEWSSVVKNHREHYQQLLKRLSRNPWQCDKVEDNPLSQNSESIWHQYFCDKELKAVIRQDVVRTFPGEEFFRRERVQDAMVNILFCYAREHPAMCYRQGMHEVLAPLLFVLHCDHQALLHATELAPVRPLISEILDPTWLEADGYSMFELIMKKIESCYRINDLTPTATGYFPANLHPPSPEEDKHTKQNEIIARLDRIRDDMLCRMDPSLYRHLLKLNISPQLFGIRWLRLLFGREFPLHDLLVLWDAIFAEGSNFDLVDFLVVSMLVAIRAQLLDSDYTTCLTYLMRYSGAVDVTQVIEYAIHLKNLEKFGDLENTTPTNTLPRKTKDVKDVPISQDQNLPTSSSSSTLKTVPKQKNSGPGRIGRWGVRGKSNRQHPNRVEPDAGVVDGFALDDPAVLRQELERLRQVTALCRIKLHEYHLILSNSTVQTQEVAMVTNGIRELCSLLNPPRPNRGLSQSEVEPALEAGETKEQKKCCVEVDMILLKEEKGQGVVGAPLPDPTATRPS